MSYIDGYVIPVPNRNKEAFREHAARMAPIFLEHGATRVVECWGTDVPDGTVTDFKRAVLAEPDEAVVFSWVLWPSRAARDAGNAKIMADARMSPGPDMPFSGKRMIYGGFEPIVDTGP